MKDWGSPGRNATTLLPGAGTDRGRTQTRLATRWPNTNHPSRVQEKNHHNMKNHLKVRIVSRDTR
eukprot:12038309-Karenia_brevis.AAC.1